MPIARESGTFDDAVSSVNMLVRLVPTGHFTSSDPDHSSCAREIALPTVTLLSAAVTQRSAARVPPGALSLRPNLISDSDNGKSGVCFSPTILGRPAPKDTGRSTDRHAASPRLVRCFSRSWSRINAGPLCEASRTPRSNRLALMRCRHWTSRSVGTAQQVSHPAFASY